MTVAKQVDFSPYGIAPNVGRPKISTRKLPQHGRSSPCPDTSQYAVSPTQTKWYKPPAPCLIAKALDLTAVQALRLLETARLSYAQGDHWIAQRYLFAALVMQCPTQSRPDPARLAQAEETLKRLL